MTKVTSLHNPRKDEYAVMFSQCLPWLLSRKEKELTVEELELNISVKKEELV